MHSNIQTHTCKHTQMADPFLAYGQPPVPFCMTHTHTVKHSHSHSHTQTHHTYTHRWPTPSLPTVSLLFPFIENTHTVKSNTHKHSHTHTLTHSHTHTQMADPFLAFGQPPVPFQRTHTYSQTSKHTHANTHRWLTPSLPTVSLLFPPKGLSQSNPTALKMERRKPSIAPQFL